MRSPGPYAPTRTAHLNGLIGQMSSSPTDERREVLEKKPLSAGDCGGELVSRLSRREAGIDEVPLDADETEVRVRQGAGEEKAGCSQGFSSNGRM